MVERLVAVDWSGDASLSGQKRKIWAGVWTCGKVTLESGRTREELVDWLIGLARETPRMVVSLDCCFSYPAWFLAEHGCATVFDFWRHVAAGHGELWLAKDCMDGRFWGRKGVGRDGKTPVEFRGTGLPRMMRRTDMENKIEQALVGGDPERAAKMKGIQAKSPFQIGGAGAVGTGSLRAMPWLLKLWESGFRVWPFEDADAGKPLLVEMYTRLLTGAVRKSNAAARKQYLKGRRKVDPLYAGISRGVIAKAEGSEDAFDALVCCVEMVRWQGDFAELKATRDERFLLEGITWRPGI